MNNPLSPERFAVDERLIDDKIEWLPLWQTIWRRKWRILSLTLAVMMLTGVQVQTITPIYRAASTLLIEPQTARVVSPEQVYGFTGTKNEYLHTQYELLISRELAERVVRELNLTVHPEFDPRQRPAPLIDIDGLMRRFDFRKLLPITIPEDLLEEARDSTGVDIFASAVKSLMARTSISPINNTQLVRIEVEMADALVAALAANTLAEAYIESQLKEISVTPGLETAYTRIVDRVVIPDIPVKPKTTLIVSLSGLLALIAGAGLTLLLEARKNTFKSSDDVETKLDLPVLGRVPLIRGKTCEEIVRLFATNRNPAFSESIRSIRTGVVLSGLESPHKVLVITSSVPGEGRSSVAANLAFALGQMEKVLLIDADMQRPSIARTFRQPVDTPGLANLLAGTARAEECINTVEGIEVITAGTVPPKPLELLSSQRFTESIEYLGSQYDRILIDSPSTRDLSGTLALSTVANAVIYVINSDTTRVPVAQKSIGKLLQIQTPVIGVVLNRVMARKGK